MGPKPESCYPGHGLGHGGGGGFHVSGTDLADFAILLDRIGYYKPIYIYNLILDGKWSYLIL